MKYRYCGFMIALLLPFLVAGCGGGSGAPGSKNSADTGIIIQSVNAVVSTPTSLGSSGGTASPDIDVAIDMCPSGQPEKGLFRSDATLSITDTALNPNTASDPFPASVEQCTVEYKKAEENPGGPVIPEFTEYPNCSLTDGGNTCDITFMDIQTKENFWNALTGGTNAPITYPVHYVGVINCSYTNAFGKTGSFQTEVDVWLADFDLCSG